MASNVNFKVYREEIEVEEEGDTVDNSNLSFKEIVKRIGLAPSQSVNEDNCEEQDDEMFSSGPMDKEAFILALVELPCIWNTKCKEYKDRNIKMNAWNLLANTFKDSGKSHFVSCYLLVDAIHKSGIIFVRERGSLM